MKADGPVGEIGAAYALTVRRLPAWARQARDWRADVGLEADMRWLREPAASVTVARDTQGAQELLLGKLCELGIPSEVLSSPPCVVANGLTLCANDFLWRCWADRLEFQLEKVDAGHTNVHVTALPDLFITRPDPHHGRIEIGALVSALRAG